VSVAYHADGEIRAHYFPIRHPDSDNFDCDQVFAWLRDLVASDVRIVTQNGLYDFGWLRAEADIKMPPSERLEEIGALATLIDENRFSYGLDALCAWRGLPGKDETVLKQAAEACGFKISKRKNPLASFIWQLPAHAVSAYAAADAAQTLALWENLSPILDKEGTRDAYRLECDLLPMVHEMRRRGIRIDTDAAERARDLLIQRRDAVFAELSEKLGANVGMEEIGRSKWLAETFDHQGITYPRTEKGNPSFTGGPTGWMLRDAHWLPPLIAKADKLNNAATKFVENYILGHVVNGRIHAEIHPHRSDAGGARSLRFSYSNPPLQQMPTHDPELGPLIRGCFLPDAGEVWAKPDLSQQEFRFIVHYAVKHHLSRSKEAAELYRTDPDTDFHQLVANWTGIDRQSAKNANFAKSFGAGVRKFAAMIRKPENEAKAIYTKYDRELRFVAQLAMHCQGTAKRQGYLELYDGARRHFNDWEAPGVYVKGAGPCALEEAQRRVKDPAHPWFGHWLSRARIHTALNALIQGSAARHTKLWMRDCWREGVVPLLQMHDALDCSVTSPEQAELVAQLGRDAVTLAVPMKVDVKFGRTWGDATHSWEELTGTAPPESASRPAPTAINGTTVHPVATIPTAPIAVPISTEVPIAAATPPSLADLVGEPLTNGKICCPFHEDSTPSCHIYSDHFHCFGCNAHGDAIDWLMMVEGLDRDEAIRTRDNWKGPISQARRAAGTTKDTTPLALRLWEQGKSIAGTLAAQYLAERRKIELAALPANVDEVLRFHPWCPFGSGTTHPCLIALMRNVETDEPTGIHRTALAPDSSKIGRMMLGRSGAVKLWPAGVTLVIGEGIETVLAAATRIPYGNASLRPAWAALSTEGLRKFPIIPAVERLVILADNDRNGEGQKAAAACRQRWTDARRAGAVLMPEAAGTDFNDLAIALLGRTT
jgi:DNA polymerase I-like protein with 3'-5' exonuclease and polymerase domains